MNYPTPINSNLLGKKFLTLLFVTIVVSVLLIWNAAQGIRGSDQYQYVADVERIAETGSSITNLHFPAKIYRENGAVTTPFISHNGPLLNVLAYFSNWISSYNSWILTNSIFHYIVSLVLFLLLYRTVEKNIAAITTSLYLVSPVAIWQSANALQENYFAALLALCALMYFYRESKFALVGLLVFLWLGAVSHPIFIVLSIFWFSWLCFSSIVNKQVFIGVVGFLGWAGLIFVLQSKSQWFPTSFQPSLSIIIRSAVPGESNMFWHFSDVLPELEGVLLQNKLTSAFYKHIFDLPNAPFYIFTNIALITGAVLLIFCWRKYKDWVLPIGLVMSLYLSIIVLQQNHSRFQQIFAVATFLIIGFVLQEMKSVNYRIAYIAALSAMLISLLGSGIFSNHLHQQSHTEELGRLKFIDDIGNIDDQARVVSIGVWRHGPMANFMRPRPYLTVRPDMMSESNLMMIVKSFEPTHLITHSDGIPNWVSLDVKEVASSEAFFGSTKIFEVVR